MQMVPDLLNYPKSVINPILKIIVPLIFLFGAYYFYRARNAYGGELGKVVRRLAIAAFIGFLASVIRYAGDLMVVWKWGESLGYLVFGIASVYAVWPLLTFIQSPQPTSKKK
jgi:hypothetical protein